MAGGGVEDFEKKCERFTLIRWFFLLVGYAVAASLSVTEQTQAAFLIAGGSDAVWLRKIRAPILCRLYASTPRPT